MKTEVIIQAAVINARVEMLKEMIKERIVPDGWNQVDEVVSRMVTELIMLHTAQMAVLMGALSNAGVSLDDDESTLNLKGQILTTALSSMLLAHFEVMASNGRSINDAHVHFDRVLRAASEDEAVVMAIIKREDDDRECNNPDCPIHGNRRSDGRTH